MSLAAVKYQLSRTRSQQVADAKRRTGKAGGQGAESEVCGMGGPRVEDVRGGEDRDGEVCLG